MILYLCVKKEKPNRHKVVRFRFLLVGRGGFEPPKSKTSDLQSDPFGHSGICPYLINARCVVEPVIGLEPTTCWLQISCSANWATPACVWCLGAELNHRQADFQSAALPTELPRHKWRPRTGSNRRPPAWQAGALTNWATGPLPYTLKQVLVYNNLFVHFCQAFFKLF